MNFSLHNCERGSLMGSVLLNFNLEVYIRITWGVKTLDPPKKHMLRISEVNTWAYGYIYLNVQVVLLNQTRLVLLKF